MLLCWCRDGAYVSVTLVSARPRCINTDLWVSVRCTRRQGHGKGPRAVGSVNFGLEKHSQLQVQSPVISTNICISTVKLSYEDVMLFSLPQTHTVRSLLLRFRVCYCYASHCSPPFCFLNTCPNVFLSPQILQPSVPAFVTVGASIL